MKEDAFAGISPEIREILLSMQAQIETLQRKLYHTIAVKDAEITHLKEVIATYQRMLFGSKSEKTVYLNQMDQLSLFHSQPAPQKKEEPQTSVVKEHTRAKKSKRNREDYIRLMIESGKFPVESVICDLPESERFDENGKPLQRMGTEHVRYELE